MKQSVNALNHAKHELARAERRLHLKAPLNVDKVVIKRPYTMVEVTYGNDRFYGFSKASPKDPFDPQVGISIATFRAVREVDETMI